MDSLIDLILTLFITHKNNRTTFLNPITELPITNIQKDCLLRLFNKYNISSIYFYEIPDEILASIVTYLSDEFQRQSIYNLRLVSRKFNSLFQTIKNKLLLIRYQMKQLFKSITLHFILLIDDDNDQRQNICSNLYYHMERIIFKKIFSDIEDVHMVQDQQGIIPYTITQSFDYFQLYPGKVCKININHVLLVMLTFHDLLLKVILPLCNQHLSNKEVLKSIQKVFPFFTLDRIERIDRLEFAKDVLFDLDLLSNDYLQNYINLCRNSDNKTIGRLYIKFQKLLYTIISLLTINLGNE
jgi:hypothetical protein